MKRSNLIRFILLFSAVFCCSQLQAQSQGKSVNVRFLFLDETAGSFWLERGSNSEEITNYPYEVSRALSFQPNSRIEIIKKPNNGSSTSESDKVRVASVTLPSTRDEEVSLLAVFHRSESSAETGESLYSVTYYNDDSRTFPERTVRVLNLGRTPFAIRMGEENAIIEPAQQSILRPQPDHKNRVPVQVAERVSSGWNMLYQSVTMVRPSERVTGLLVYSPSGMRHTYHEIELEEYGDPPPGHFWLTYTDRP